MMQRSWLVYGISVPLLLGSVAWSGTGYAQPAPGDHAQHHPPGASSSQAAPASALDADASASMPLPPAPPSGSSMGTMMESMTSSAPQQPLMSRLLNVERLSATERQTFRDDAERQVETGLQILEQGLIDFAAARQTRDDAALARAIGGLQDGARHWEIGMAVLRTLSTPDTVPRDPALTWFKTQMQLESALPSLAPLPWGLSWTHLGGMLSLGLFAIGALAIYLYKVRRTVLFLDRLTRGKHEGTR